MKVETGNTGDGRVYVGIKIGIQVRSGHNQNKKYMKKAI